MDRLPFGVQNRRSENINRIWITGGTKKQLIDVGIKDIISAHNWYNWDFSITLDDAEKLGIIESKEKILLQRKYE